MLLCGNTIPFFEMVPLEGLLVLVPSFVDGCKLRLGVLPGLGLAEGLLFVVCGSDNVKLAKVEGGILQTPRSFGMYLHKGEEFHVIVIILPDFSHLYARSGKGLVVVF